MSGDVEAQNFLLAHELLAAGPVRHLRKRLIDRSLLRRKIGEEPGLPAPAIAPDALHGFDGAFYGSEQLRARAFERIHGAGADQTFDHAPVERAQVHVLAEFVYRA